jgi:hypothetical protein
MAKSDLRRWISWRARTPPSRGECTRSRWTWTVSDANMRDGL